MWTNVINRTLQEQNVHTIIVHHHNFILSGSQYDAKVGSTFRSDQLLCKTIVLGHGGRNGGWGRPYERSHGRGFRSNSLICIVHCSKTVLCQLISLSCLSSI